jgi:hypothetical protein
MHIVFLVLSYAFSAWMLIDAVKRGARHWWMIIILVPFGEFIYFFTVKIKDFKGFFERWKRGKNRNSPGGAWGRGASEDIQLGRNRQLGRGGIRNLGARDTLQCKSCIYCEAVDEDGVVCLKNGRREFIPIKDARLCYDYQGKRDRLR